MADVNHRMEKETPSDESSDSDEKESTNILKNAEDKKTKKKTSIKLKVKSDEDKVDLINRMEKETRLNDESSNKVEDESTYLLKNAESEKTEKKASIKMKVESDKDKEEDMVNFSRMKEETQFVEPQDSDEEEENSEEDEEYALGNWIKQNIRTKVKAKSDEDNKEDIIKEVETNNFGAIEFKGAKMMTERRFVQMSDETPADIIVNLLTKQFKLPEPQILISITGSAKLFKMKEDFKEVLRDGLRKITESPATWVITGGTNTGITEFVGESLVTKSLIGISTLGTITNVDSLSESYRGESLQNRVASSLTEHRTFLDHNHPLHLLVDDASKKEYGKEIPLVSRLLKYAAYKKDRKALSVMLLVDVGVNSLENVINAVAGEEPIPVLVVKGSGRAEHVLSYAMQCYDEIDLSGEIIHERLVNFIRKNIGLHEDSKKFYMNVLKCLEHHHMISMVALNKEEGIDVKILKALLKYYDLANEQLLQYTMLCNRVDMAEDLFLDTSIVWEKKSIDDSMIMALALNSYEVVEYFVDNNVSIHKLVTQPLLEFLYEHRSSREQSIVRHYVARSSSRYVHHHFFALLERKEMQLGIEAYITPYENICNFLSLLCKTMNLDMPQEYVSDDSRTEDDDELNWYSKYPYRDLFLWAVVNNMQDMAKLFWKLGYEQVAKAIVAAEINRKLVEKAEEKHLPNETIQAFKENEIEFRELALKVLDSCYAKDSSDAKLLLISKLFQFRSQNCIRLANESCFQEFIAHKAVQQVLKELWCGKLKYESNLITLKGGVGGYWWSTKHDELLTVGKKRTYIEHSSTHRTYMLVDGQQQYKESDNRNKHAITKFLSYPFDAPVRKFIGSLVSYCIFLMLISYCAVLKKEDATPNVIEIIVFVWVVSYAVEELYQASVRSEATILRKLYNHLKSIFNVVDLTALTLYFIAFVLQLNSSSMGYGHLLYAIDAMLWIVRLLQYFYASKILGIYVIMIGRMFIDMCYFISILVVFVLAYGVLSTAILRPETRIFNMIKNIIYFPYFNIYGEFFVDNDSSPGMTKFGTKVISDYAEPISWVFLGLFLLIANVLLLNLLIAVFGNTFAEVKEKADQIWRFNRHDLVTEYALKLSFPPPFTVFIYIWKKISTRKRSQEYEQWYEDAYSDFIRGFPREYAKDVLRVQETELQKDTINEKMENLSEQNKTLQEQNKTLQEQTTNLNKTMETNNDVLKLLQEQITNLNKTTARMENYFTQMNPLPKND